MKRILGILLLANAAVAQTTVINGWGGSGSSGTTTSVGLAMPSTFCGVTGSPVTTSGTLTCSYATGQTANLIFGTNSSGNVGLMNLTAAQLPSIASTFLSDSSSLIRSTDTGTVTNTMLAGSIANGKLTNASTTVNGTTCTLGSTCTISAGDTTAKYIIGATDATLTNAKVWPTLYASVDAPPASPTIYDDEFDGGSLASQWTWLNQGSNTVTFTHGLIGIAAATGSLNNLSGIYETLPATPWQFDTKLTCQTSAGQTSVLGLCGIILRDSSGKAIFFYARTYSNGGFTVTTYNYATSANTDSTHGWQYGFPQSTFYLRVKDDGTNLTFYVSADGNTFMSAVDTRSATAWLTSGPTQIGIGTDPNSAAGAGSTVWVDCDWFRRTL